MSHSPGTSTYTYQQRERLGGWRGFSRSHSQGLRGTISGSHVTLSAWFGEEPEDHMYGEGTASKEEIKIAFEGGPFGSGSIRMGYRFPLALAHR